MDEPIEAYDPTILTGLGLFLTLCMPVIFMTAIFMGDFLPFGMTSIMFAPVVGMFTTPIGLLVLLGTFLQHKKQPNKMIKWTSALPGSIVALGLGTIVWFLTFSFGIH